MASSHPQQQRRPSRRSDAYATRTQDTNSLGVQISGRRDLWISLQVIRDYSTNTTKTTRLLQIPSGVLINTCTRGPTGMCEALQYIPGATSADFRGGAA